MVLINCQSVCNKKTELEVMLISVQPDIVIATESWLITPDIHNSEIFPANYTVYRKDLDNQDGGGVFILVSNKLISTAVDEYALDNEAIWVQIQESRGPNITVAAYYRSPNKDLDDLKCHSRVVGEVMRTCNGTIIITGDYNLPGVDWSF